MYISIIICTYTIYIRRVPYIRSTAVVLILLIVGTLRALKCMHTRGYLAGLTVNYHKNNCHRAPALGFANLGWCAVHNINIAQQGVSYFVFFWAFFCRVAETRTCTSARRWQQNKEEMKIDGVEGTLIVFFFFSVAEKQNADSFLSSCRRKKNAPAARWQLKKRDEYIDEQRERRALCMHARCKPSTGGRGEKREKREIIIKKRFPRAMGLNWKWKK